MAGKIIRIVNTLRKEDSFFLEERSNSVDIYIYICARLPAHSQRNRAFEN